MKTNGYSGQLLGPFVAGEELMDRIRQEAVKNIDYVKHLGIQISTPSLVIINEKEIEVGKTNIYEIGNTKINSISFLHNTDNSAIVDYTVVLKEE